MLENGLSRQLSSLPSPAGGSGAWRQGRRQCSSNNERQSRSVYHPRLRSPLLDAAIFYGQNRKTVKRAGLPAVFFSQLYAVDINDHFRVRSRNRHNLLLHLPPFPSSTFQFPVL